MKVKCKIIEATGQNQELDKFSVISDLVSSLFSQVDILFGEKIISSSTNTYSYIAYIEFYILT